MDFMNDADWGQECSCSCLCGNTADVWGTDGYTWCVCCYSDCPDVHPRRAYENDLARARAVGSESGQEVEDMIAEGNPITRTDEVLSTLFVQKFVKEGRM